MSVPGIDPTILANAFMAPIGVHTVTKPTEVSSNDLFVVAMSFYLNQLVSMTNSVWESFRVSQNQTEERKRTEQRTQADRKLKEEASRRHFEAIDPSFELQLATLLEARRQAAQFRYLEGDEVPLRLPA